MKKLLLMSVALVSAIAMAENAKLSLADAEAKITGAIENAKEMAATMTQLSAADQKAFLAKVNAAIASYNVSEEEKAALFVTANATALKSAQKGNVPTLLAETFATVPVNALTVVNERFAEDLFSRSADPSKTYDDASYLYICTNAMHAIQERCAGESNAGVRDTFAALMFLRASEGGPKDLRETLVAGLPDAETRDLAAKEWIPSALGDNGQKPTYDPMLGVTGEESVVAEAERLYLYLGPQDMNALLHDLHQSLLSKDSGVDTAIWDAIRRTEYERGTGESLLDPQHRYMVPRTLDQSKPWYNGGQRGDKPAPVPVPPPEPDPYLYSTLH